MLALKHIYMFAPEHVYPRFIRSLDPLFANQFNPLPEVPWKKFWVFKSKILSKIQSLQLFAMTVDALNSVCLGFLQ